MIQLFNTPQLLLAAAGGEAAGGPAAIFGQFVPLILIFVVFYFLLIRPNQKKQQQHKEMLNNLKRGDKVITTGGLYGTIDSLTDTAIQLKIANQVKIKVLRSAIAGVEQGESEETTE